MSAPLRTYLIFSGSGPLLLLSSYPSLLDPRLLAKLEAKGVQRFLGFDVDLESARARYAETFERVAADLSDIEDVRVLDFNGHQIMSRFSLAELGEPIRHDGSGE